MRNVFRGYYRPTGEELETIWSTGDLILDTNALLNLFRYTRETREEFLGVLAERRARLWIPHEVGVEFHRNRRRVVFEQGEPFDKLDAVVRAAREDVERILAGYRNKEHPSLDDGAISAVWAKALESVDKEMAAAREQHREYGGVVENIFETVADLYEGRVGDPYADGVLSELHVEADARYVAKIPPGYKDSDKPAPQKYGDLIIWRQILDRGSEQKRPAIFVTDDSKEDWWDREKGQTYGPRPELVEEYYSRTGCRIHFYTPKRFLEFANPSVSTRALDEVEQVSIDREAAAAAESGSAQPASSEASSEGEEDLVQTVARALRVLEVVTRSPGLQVKAIARRSGLSLSATYRLVRTLAYQGYVTRLKDGTYDVGNQISDRFYEQLDSRSIEGEPERDSDSDEP